MTFKDIKMIKKSILTIATLLLVHDVAYADTAQDDRNTLQMREYVVAELQRRADYDNQHEKAQQVLDIIIPKVASSFFVCDGHYLIQDINNTNEIPVEIYQDGELDLSISLQSFDSYSQAQKLNGYQWKGGVHIGIEAQTYRPAGTDIWQNRYKNGYDIGYFSTYNGTLEYQNNQLVKPVQTQYMSNKEYYDLPYFRLQKIQQYRPATCAELNKQIQSIHKKEKVKKVGAMALGILGIVDSIVR